jgi:hypothetical protein
VILLTAVGAGILAGWGCASWTGRTWHPPVFRAIWLVTIGFLPQGLAFYWPFTRQMLSDETAAFCLVISQMLLLTFALLNLHLPGMWLLASGLACNLAVIAANHGFMPMTVEAFSSLSDTEALERMTFGARLGQASKDILLPESQILFPWLADRFVFPNFMPYRVAFSWGDVLVAAGAFWMLWSGQTDLPVLESGVA